MIREVPGFKLCIGCETWQPIDQYNRKSNPNKCRTCLNAYNRKYFHNNKAQALSRSRRYRATIKGRAKLIYTQIFHRGKKNDWPVTITQEDIERRLQNGCCEGSGLPLNLHEVGVHWENPYGPSIDRIRSDEGYTDENAQIVCNMYNRGKNKHDELDFIVMCCAVAERNRDRPDVIRRLAEVRHGEF